MDTPMSFRTLIGGKKKDTRVRPSQSGFPKDTATWMQVLLRTKPPPPEIFESHF